MPLYFRYKIYNTSLATNQVYNLSQVLYKVKYFMFYFQFKEKSSHCNWDRSKSSLPVETGMRSCWTGIDVVPAVWLCNGWPVKKNCGAATWGWPNSCDWLDNEVKASVRKKKINDYIFFNMKASITYILYWTNHSRRIRLR